MPKTVKELVELKLNSLKGKAHVAHQYVFTLHNNVESIPLDANSLLILDNMILSLDEIVTNFDDVVTGSKETAKTEIKLMEGSASNVPMKQQSHMNVQHTDIVGRMDRLEEAMNVMTTTIHGDGDGDSSHPTGILSHMSVLENSFNDGKQKLVSMEHRMQEINGRHVDFMNEMRSKVLRGEQRKEMDDVTLERFKNLEEKIQETSSDNNVCKQRLTSVEDEIKSVKATKIILEDQRKEMENISMSEQFKNMEEKVQETISELKLVNTNADKKKEQIEKLEKKVQERDSVTDDNKQRLSCIENQLKSIKSNDDVKETEEIKDLKLQVSKLDALTKTQILDRISFLENRPKAAFSVFLKHDGPWKKGTAIRNVDSVEFNVGNAFEEDKCRFVVPVDGIYCLYLYLNVVGDGSATCVELWTCEVVGGGWNGMINSVTAQGNVNDGCICDVSLVQLKKGEAIRARVNGGNKFHQCIFNGWLVSPDH